MLAIIRFRTSEARHWARCLAVLLALSCAAAAQARTIALNAEERLWIAEHPVVRYGFDATGVPYSFEDHGVHSGLDADLLALIGSKTGLRFVAESGMRFDEAIEAVRAGTIPMVSFITPGARRARFMHFSAPAVKVQYGIFTGPRSPLVESLADLSGKRVAVRTSFGIEPLAPARGRIDIVTFADAVEALRAVASGEVQATVAAIATGAYAERTLGLTRVVLQGVLPESYPLSFGVSADERVLLAILDKALASVSPDEMRVLKTRWLVGDTTFTSEELLATAATTAAVVMLLASLVVTWLYGRLRRQYAKLAALEDRLRELATVDDMSGLGNRRAFNEALAAEVKRADRQFWPLALIELDLDYFKRINDLHGHEVGDAAISEVGRVIRSDLRVGENAYRVGGEEFAVILPDSDADGAYLVAERIRSRIEGITSLPSRLTASFGVVVREPGTSLPPETLFSRADRSLYEAKDAGRNCIRISGESTPRERPAGAAALTLGYDR